MRKELITPITQSLLEERHSHLTGAHKGALGNYGGVTGGEGGDAEHGEEQYMFLNNHDMAARQLVDFQGAYFSAEIAQAPTQTETVEVFHRVEVIFDGDQDDRAQVTIVTPINLDVLKDWEVKGKKVFDPKRRELLVSSESPLGSSLLGKRKGDNAKYTTTEVRTTFETSVEIANIGIAQIF